MVNGHKCWIVVGLHLIASVDDQISGATVDRRVDRAVLQLYFGVLHGSEVSSHRSLERFRIRLHGVILFFGHNALVPESGVTAGLDNRIGRLGFVPG